MRISFSAAGALWGGSVFSFKSGAFALREKAVFLLRLVFSFCFGGEECLCCGTGTLVLPLCRSCWRDFSRPDFSRRCGMCGKPLVSEVGRCSLCRSAPVITAAERVFPLHPYRLWKKELLSEWKTRGSRVLSVYFAELVARKLAEIRAECGELFIVPVPPRPGKTREAGWDQIDELCFYLSRGWHLKVVPALTRLSRTEQKRLGRRQRLGTIGRSYALSKRRRARKMLAGARGCAVVLDDVITTGATAQRCAELLREAGVSRVFVVSLFIVD